MSLSWQWGLPGFSSCQEGREADAELRAWLQWRSICRTCGSPEDCSIVNVGIYFGIWLYLWILSSVRSRSEYVTSADMVSGCSLLLRVLCPWKLYVGVKSMLDVSFSAIKRVQRGPSPLARPRETQLGPPWVPQCQKELVGSMCPSFIRPDMRPSFVSLDVRSRKRFCHIKCLRKDEVVCGNHFQRLTCCSC